MASIKKIIPILLCFSGGLLTLYGIFLTTIINFNIGLVGTIGMGLTLLFWGLFWKQLQKICQSGWQKRAYATFVCGFVLFLGTVAFLAFSGQTDQVTYKEDAIIVLGAGIHGEKVSRVLQMRLDSAVSYANKNPKALLVVSGGQGQGETISEALAMERYLIEKGIPQDKIIKEDRSTSTEENFKFSKTLLDQYFDGDYQTAFTTNSFHIFRAQIISQNCGMKSNSLHAPIDGHMLPVVYIREVLALYIYLLFG